MSIHENATDATAEIAGEAATRAALHTDGCRPEHDEQQDDAGEAQMNRSSRCSSGKKLTDHRKRKTSGRSSAQCDLAENFVCHGFLFAFCRLPRRTDPANGRAPEAAADPAGPKPGRCSPDCDLSYQTKSTDPETQQIRAILSITRDLGPSQ